MPNFSFLLLVSHHLFKLLSPNQFEWGCPLIHDGVWYPSFFLFLPPSPTLRVLPLSQFTNWVVPALDCFLQAAHAFRLLDFLLPSSFLFLPPHQNEAV